MTQIAILKPKAGKPGQLTIDIVVKLPSGLHHISRLTHSGKGLYDVARTYQSPESPVDIHNSYHPSGEMHGRLTRGKLMLLPGGQLLAKAQPHTRAKEVLLWQRKGQPWDSLKGVEKFAQHRKGVQSLTNTGVIAAGYPIYKGSDADHAFEIDAESLPSADVDIEYFLVEPGNVAALEAAIREITDSWHSPHYFLAFERAELFTNLSPWLAIVLLAKRANGLNRSRVGSQRYSLRL